MADGERRAAPGADQEARVAGENDGERKGAFELRERRGRGLFRVEAPFHVESIRWGTTSVSVSETSSRPSASSLALSSR